MNVVSLQDGLNVTYYTGMVLPFSWACQSFVWLKDLEGPLASFPSLDRFNMSKISLCLSLILLTESSNTYNRIQGIRIAKASDLDYLSGKEWPIILTGPLLNTAPWGQLHRLLEIVVSSLSAMVLGYRQQTERAPCRDLAMPSAFRSTLLIYFLHTVHPLKVVTGLS